MKKLQTRKKALHLSSEIKFAPRTTRPKKISLEQIASLRIANLHALVADIQNSGRGMVALDGYLHALTDHIVGDVGDIDGKTRIVILVNADPVQVPVRVAGMISQIVSELVDAVRHDFGSTRRGTIHIECGLDADGTILLRVGSDGKKDIDGVLRIRLGGSARPPHRGGPGKSPTIKISTPLARNEKASRSPAVVN